MKTICEAAPRSPEWFAARREGITATDISVILGNNPWKTPLQVWEDKVGLSGPTPDNTAMRVGRGVEPVIIDLASDGHGAIRTFPGLPSIVGWDTDPLVRASLDGLDETGHPVEAKATRNGWSRTPTHYEDQVLWQTGIVGADYGTLAVLQGTDYSETRIAFDRDWWDWATAEAATWWQRHIIDGEAPGAVVGDDMARMFAPDPEAAVDVPLDVWGQYTAARAAEEKAIADRRGLEVAIQERVGAATSILVEGSRVATWRASKGRSSFDKKALETDQPGAVAQYTVAGKPGRTWRLSR